MYSLSLRIIDRFPGSGALLKSMLRVVMLLLLPLAALAQPGGAPTVNDTSRVYVPGRIEIDTTDWRFRVGPLYYFREELKADQGWRDYLDSVDNAPLAVMRRNLAFHMREWMPTPAEREARAREIWRSQGLDKIHTNHYVNLAQVPLAGIWRALGLVEDVTPRISYTLTATQHVSVKVYRLTAEPVVTLVDSEQAPGVYSFDWDMLDESGVRVQAGDYIAEVISAKRVLLRKRIEVP